MRVYWQAGLSRLPDLHFELVDVLAGIDSLVILYRGHRGLSDESFTSIDLRITFFRPVWRSTLVAKASPVRLGRTISHYQCEIFDEGNKQVALASGTITTLRGPAADGR